ncbi:MAG: hypothetical protein EOO61_01820 [Hymenobacter sp.]|nr:MAG: hypothetical protein EOO61_01820 [Hymenobacter sp.]
MESIGALNPLIEDIAFILNSHTNEIANMVRSMYQTFEEHGHPPKDANALRKEDIMMEGTSRYALILVCSFIDEWDDQIATLIGKGVERDRFLKLKKIAKPALDGIRSFTGLRDYRSKLLAHNSRIGHEGNRNAFRGSFIAELLVPITLPDFKFIANCIYFCQEVFNKEFEEYKRLPGDFIAEHTDRSLPKGMTTAECDARLKVIQENINRLGKAEK